MCRDLGLEVRLTHLFTDHESGAQVLADKILLGDPVDRLIWDMCTTGELVRAPEEEGFESLGKKLVEICWVTNPTDLNFVQK